MQTHLNVEYDVLWEMVLPLSEDPRLYLSTRFRCLGHFLGEERGFYFRRERSKALIRWVGMVVLGLSDVFKFTSSFGRQEL